MRVVLLLVVVAMVVCCMEDGVSGKELPTLPKDGMGSIYKGGPWRSASATFYSEAIGGACGYTNVYSGDFESDTTALSAVLFNKGFGCGECFEIKCVNSPHCYGSTYITVTATNLCPPNLSKPSNNGGWCNPPREHFDLSIRAFTKLASLEVGFIPVMYHKVPCSKNGGLVFTMARDSFWNLIYITNVGGPGDIASVSIKGDQTGWIPMTKNWGAAFQALKNLKGQRLSFQITSYTTKKTIVANNVIPYNWNVGQTYKTSIQLV